MSASFAAPAPLLASATADCRAGRDLPPALAGEVALALASPEPTPAEKAELLRALADKGESPAEVLAFAETFRGLTRPAGVPPALAAGCLDIVGTGGDHSGSFNLSTTAALVCAAAGVPIAKHGNRAATSQSGSADFLAALGIPLDPGPERLRAGLAEVGFAFYFAPAWHPAFAHIGPVRKALAAEGRRTIFNLLGPLINPARPAHTVLGVFAGRWAAPMASALSRLSAGAGAVVHATLPGGGTIDEVTTASTNSLLGTGPLAGLDLTDWTAETFGLAPGTLADLQGGTAADNVALLHRLFAGTAPRALEDSVALNAAVGLWVAGRVGSLAEGLLRARQLLRSGAVAAYLERLRTFYI